MQMSVVSVNREQWNCTLLHANQQGLVTQHTALSFTLEQVATSDDC